MWQKFFSLFLGLVPQNVTVAPLPEVWQTVEETRGILGIEEAEVLEAIHEGKLEMRVMEGIPMINYQSIRRYHG